MIKATRRRAASVLRTPGAVVLLSVGAVCMTAILLFAPEDVRSWLLGAGGLGAVTTAAGLFVRLRDGGTAPTAAPAAAAEDDDTNPGTR
jgi:hypothetical protein